jgi:hypothetical protein
VRKPAEALEVKPRYALKKDANHSDIAAYLEANGCEVRDCSREGTIPDLLVRYRTACPAFLEIKVAGSAAKWTREQLQFISMTRFDVAIANSQEGALFAVKTREFLSQGQKDKLAVYLCRIVKKFYTPAEIEKVLT